MKNSNIFELINISKVVVSFILVLLVSIVVSISFFDLDDRQLTRLLSFYSDITILFGFVYFALIKKNFFNQYSFFWFSLSLFTFGHVILFSMGLTCDKLFIIENYSVILVNKYIIYGLCSLAALLLAGSFVLNFEQASKAYKIAVLENEDYSKEIFFTMFVISAPFFLFNLSKIMSIASVYGYSEVYQEKGNAFVASISMFYVPSLFGLIYSYKENLKKYFFLFFLMIPVVIQLMIGTRSRPVAIVMCLIFFWNKCIQKLSRGQVVVLFAFAIFIFLLLPSIAEYRNMSNLSFWEVFQQTVASGLIDNLTKVLGEFGNSAQIWLRLQKLIPDIYDYHYGFSYIASFLSCIPSVLFGGYSFAEHANLSDWITNIEHSSYGLGFSMLGEAYYNFGWLGPVGIFFVGLFIFITMSCCWLPSCLKKYSTVFSTIALYIFATNGRGAMYLEIRSVFYCIIIPAVLIYMTRRHV